LIRHLELVDVGPARHLTFDFAPRLNVLTGDNGLGKTFVLDVIWWVLTTTWAGEKAFPLRGPQGALSVNPGIRARLFGRAPLPIEEPAVDGRWSAAHQDWTRAGWSPAWVKLQDPPVLLVYARVDGSFAVWDAPLYAKGASTDLGDAAVVLGGNSVWDGLETDDPEVPGRRRTVINGLIADWVSWQQRARSPEFDALRAVLLALSSETERLIPGEPTRVHLRDRRDIPTLETSYGLVPVTQASAGVRRAISLAYLLVWAWTEHQKAAAQSGRAMTREIVLLIDEPELHLHPAWQRVFLPAVMRAVEILAPEASVQTFTATHSPMVLASLESVFDEERDDLFVLERDGRVIQAKELVFAKQGDVSSWLASEVFGGVGGRSTEATLAIEAAMHFMADRKRDAEAALSRLNQRLAALPEGGDEAPTQASLFDRVHGALVRALADADPFWVQWVGTYEQGAAKG
jgi:hypothetical protein